jgi:hypothetical protein
MRGVTRRHETWSGIAVDVDVPADERQIADGEVVWSWRAHAGAKFSDAQRRSENDGGKRWFTGESTYKP